MKNKLKGISLIVLVITIIVMIIIATVIVVSLSNSNIINKANSAVDTTNIKSLQEAADMFYVEYKSNKLEGSIGEYIKEKIISNNILKAEEAGSYFFDDDVTIVKKENSPWNYIKNVNKPVLTTGMTPVKWVNDTTQLTSESDSDWYDYGTRKWANATTADGSMWVWIPRYEYKIPEPHINASQTILINFLPGVKKSASDGYIIHPAFTFGDKELTGIWIAKFKASGSTSNITILPGQTQISSVSIDNAFTACRNMETKSSYGWGTTGEGIDTHLMKNIEWGAVSYLSHSTYGKNNKLDDQTSALTGAGTNLAYVTNTGKSTTNNVYGIYDMAGDKWEYVAAYVNNANSALSTNGLSLLQSENKYKDIYIMGSGDNRSLTYELNLNKKGDAIYETSSETSAAEGKSWYGQSSGMPYSATPFFTRKNLFGYGYLPGWYYPGFGSGGADSKVSFRPTLICERKI